MHARLAHRRARGSANRACAGSLPASSERAHAKERHALCGHARSGVSRRSGERATPACIRPRDRHRRLGRERQSRDPRQHGLPPTGARGLRAPDVERLVVFGIAGLNWGPSRRGDQRARRRLARPRPSPPGASRRTAPAPREPRAASPRWRDRLCGPPHAPAGGH